MGRNIPPYHDYNHNYNDHPLLSLTFLIACIAATIAVVSSLCGALSKKKPPGAPVCGDESPPRNQEILPSSSPPKAESTSTTEQAADVEGSNKSKNEGSKRGRRKNSDVARPLPPPPARSTSCHVRSQSTPMSPPGGNKLDTSMSMRVSTGSAALSSMRQGSKRAENNKTKYLKHEDSIWKKAIILGEKCRVPDEDEVVYDEKGNRISTYHPKTKSNAFEILSRQNSNADPEKPIHNA